MINSKKSIEKPTLQLSEDIVDTLQVPILVLNKSLQVITSNVSFYTKFKVSKETTIGEFIYDLGDGQWDIPSLRRMLEEILPQENEIKNYEVTHNFPSIGKRTMTINARQIAGDDTVKEYVLLSIEDITDKLYKEQRLKDISRELFIQKEKAESTLLSIGDGFISTDIDGRISEFNKISEKLTGYSRAEAIGKPFNEVFQIYDEALREERENPIQKVLETGKKTSIEKNTVLISKNGDEHFIEDSVSPIFSKDGDLIGAVLIFRDVTQLKIKIKKNEFLINHDYLTGLHNRRWFMRKLHDFNSQKYFPLGIIMIDINGLKIINDAFGHKQGDTLLKRVGGILKDIFESRDIISRIGGDEFAIIVPKTSFKVLEKYKIQLKEVARKQKIHNVELSVAIGYEIKKKVNEDYEDILKSAENQMYSNKTTEGSSFRSKAIHAILQTLTDKYDIEREHSQRVSQLSTLIGKELKLMREDEIKQLEQAGLFHDIGKISIPDKILNKQGKLTDEEFEIMKTHTLIGYQILRAADEYSDLAIHALHHHERWNGSGYPKGLKGEKIPLYSRIIFLADAYDAMTSDRPYRKKMSKEYAVSEIKRCSGTQFDPKIAKIFLNNVLQKHNI